MLPFKNADLHFAAFDASFVKSCMSERQFGIVARVVDRGDLGDNPCTATKTLFQSCDLSYILVYKYISWISQGQVLSQK